MSEQVIKIMESDIAAEAGVLGSMILEPKIIPAIRDKARTEYFTTEANQIIFAAILAVYDKGNKNGDAVNLRAELTTRGKLSDAGGVDYLAEILNSVPSSANAEFYLDQMIDAHKLQQLSLFGQKTAFEAGEPGTVAEKYAAADKALRAISGNILRINHQADIEDVVEDVSFESGEIFISSGFSHLDDIIYGLGKGDLMIVGARPGMGKTSLLASMALNLCRDGRSTAFFSMEMSQSQLLQRMLCSAAEIDLGAALHGTLSAGQAQALTNARAELGSCGLTIDTTPAITPEQLRSKILALQERRHINAVFVDYMGLMRTTSKKQSLYEATSEISRSLKAIALEVDLPIIAAAQLNRAVEGREDKRPRLSDLRDSGSIEQDADVVVLLYRADYYNDTKDGISELNIAKNRRGITQTLTMQFIGTQTRFIEGITS